MEGRGHDTGETSWLHTGHRCDLREGTQALSLCLSSRWAERHHSQGCWREDAQGRGDDAHGDSLEPGMCSPKSFVVTKYTSRSGSSGAECCSQEGLGH